MNTKKHLFLIILACCFFSTQLMAQDRADPIKQLLFPPELIMKHRSKLDLDEEQEKILKEEMQIAQAAVFDLRWNMNEESEKLAGLLRATPVDENALLAQADIVMSIEHQVKRTHLVFLARLKNMLTPEQVQTLRRLRYSSPTDSRRPDARRK